MKQPEQPRDRIVFPLDVTDIESAATFVDLLASDVGIFKVGLELFTASGPASINLIHDHGCACFLDLKMHDISETMARAVASAVRHNVEYLTVHASAGTHALRRAQDVAENSKTRLLAVTVLTSLGADDLTSLGIGESTSDHASRLAELACDAGISGFVCSPHEISSLRKVCGDDACFVVPGVRPQGVAVGDQQRVATPTDAILWGADLLVIGRPIRDARDPVAATRAIHDEIRTALASALQTRRGP